jgi:hypothetical protein
MTEELIIVELIEYNSQEFQQACQLRYELFFAEHGLAWNVVQNKRQANYFHGAILRQNSVVAYGQLVPQDNRVYQILPDGSQTWLSRTKLWQQDTLLLN